PSFLLSRGISVFSIHLFILVSVSLACVIAGLKIFEGKEILKNNFFWWEKCKLICNFWSVCWLVRIANVLTLVRWLFSSVYFFFRCVN
ncbi:MAG: hypothetical protein KDC92_15280, partial [Bacteroidetes bacterium]|nr:hypothetical protein [Bacteroidota bacterium]